MKRRIAIVCISLIMLCFGACKTVYMQEYDTDMVSLLKIENVDSAIYYPSHFTDDFVYAEISPSTYKNQQIDPDYDMEIVDIYLNENFVAQVELYHSSELSVQWIDEDTVLIMHMYLLDVNTGEIEITKIENLLYKDRCFFSVQTADLIGDMTLLSSCVDAENGIIYYSLCADEYTYYIYRYILNDGIYEKVYSEKSGVSEGAGWLFQFVDNRLFFRTLSGTYCYIDDEVELITEELVFYISPKAEYCMKIDNQVFTIVEMSTMQEIYELDADSFPSLIWLNDDIFVYGDVDRIIFYSLQGNSEIRKIQVDGAVGSWLSLYNNVLYH